MASAMMVTSSRSGFSSASSVQLAQGGRRVSGPPPSSAGRAPSMYGGAGGFGTRISRAASLGSLAGVEWSISTNEKHTMQNLNDRLAAYLEKVHSLEQSNAELELKIQEYYNKRTAGSSKDLTLYYSTIADLRKEISAAFMHTARQTLQLDTARLAADDFRVKYESEHNTCEMVELDLSRMRKVLDDLTISKSDLEVQVEGLREELGFLKKDHTEEMSLLRSQQAGSVSVEVDCARTDDLTMELQNMREQYEALVQRNRREAEIWFQKKTEVLKTQMSSSTTEINTSKSELSDLRRSYQSLEIELQGLHAQRVNSESRLQEVRQRSVQQIGVLQEHINILEVELKQLHADMEHQAEEYRILLDIKMRLEMEIAEYRRLLDGEECRFRETVTTDSRRTVVVHELEHLEQVEQLVQVKQVEQVEQLVQVKQVEQLVQMEQVVEEEHGPHVQRRVKTIVEEIVDGQVVSSSVDEKVHDIALPY
ncbi:keratin, type I cytoskeletal 19-like [Lepisosteus oculatus]|uniref:keratin, type I cytoskeletal 19-like n=1 Tax=Lepisosteus oculatus TaxID=7918 RepID=UPI00371FB32F